MGQDRPQRAAGVRADDAEQRRCRGSRAARAARRAGGRSRRRSGRRPAGRGCRTSSPALYDGRMPSSRIAVVVAQHRGDPAAAAAVLAAAVGGRRGSSTGSKRRCSQFIRASWPGLGQLVAPTRSRRARRGPCASRAMTSSSASTSAGLPSHQVATRSGRVRATREPGHVRPGRQRQAERPAGQPDQRERLGQHVRQADHAGDRGVLLGRGGRHRPGAEVADQLGHPQPRVEVGVGLDRQRPRRVAEQQRIGRRPAAVLGAGQRVAADERAPAATSSRTASSTGVFSVPTSVSTRAAARGAAASDASASAHLRQRHREHDEIGAVHGGGVGRRDRESGGAGRGRGRRDRCRSRRPRCRCGASRASSSRR